jgi:phosphatidylglycerophosphate synthase
VWRSAAQGHASERNRDLAVPATAVRVASLRNRGEVEYAGVIDASETLISAWRKRATLSITAVRVPIACAGVAAVLQRQGVMAISLFTAFAILDLFDGIAARASGLDTALRRSADVIIDRTAIHAAILGCVALFSGTGLAISLIFLLRDLLQASYSLQVYRRHRLVVVGPHWHMAYGLTMLLWGSTFLSIGHPEASTTILALTVSYSTFVDYVRRCQRLLKGQ